MDEDLLRTLRDLAEDVSRFPAENDPTDTVTLSDRCRVAVTAIDLAKRLRDAGPQRTKLTLGPGEVGTVARSADDQRAIEQHEQLVRALESIGDAGKGLWIRSVDVRVLHAATARQLPTVAGVNLGSPHLPGRHLLSLASGSTDSDDPNYDPELAKIAVATEGKPVSRQAAITEYSLRRILQQPPAQEREPNSPTAPADDEWLSSSEIAKRFEVKHEPLRKRLEYWRKTKAKHGEWAENRDRRTANEPLYLYRLGAVRSIAEDLRDSS